MPKKTTQKDMKKNNDSESASSTDKPSSNEKQAQKTSSIVEDQTVTKKIPKVRLNKVVEKLLKRPGQLMLVALVLLFGGLSIFLMVSTSESRNKLLSLRSQNTNVVTQDLLNKISEITIVPTDEVPTVATITDVSKLKDQVFFSNAENGDKLLVYPRASRAILYRPSTNKVVEAMTVNLENIGGLTAGNSSGAAVESNSGNSEGDTDTNENTSQKTDDISKNIEELEAIVEKPVRVAIYNSTATAGLAGSLGRRLSSDFQEFNVEIVDIGDAAGTYDASVVVNNAGIDDEAVQAVAKYLEMTVGERPEAEGTSDADIVVYIGSDF